MEIEIGACGKAEAVVDESNTAWTIGSGDLQVFATPAMVALMEKAAVNSLVLPNGQSSVGTYLEIKHLAATPVGNKVWAIATLVKIDRRKLVFDVEAYDETEKIGSGKHERFLVEIDGFLNKINSKVAKIGE